jgi:hypothetical protein
LKQIEHSIVGITLPQIFDGSSACCKKFELDFPKELTFEVTST